MASVLRFHFVQREEEKEKCLRSTAVDIFKKWNPIDIAGFWNACFFVSARDMLR